MNPVGVLIGWTLSDRGSLIRGIFESVSAGIIKRVFYQLLGTFLYVALGEILLKEFNDEKHIYRKFFYFFLAFLMASSLSFIEHKNEEVKL
jgi:hypothetical protein